MSQWEFLLQRKGDMAWLSLESTAAEILEGQYRVAVRSPDQANAAVSITINYRPSNDSPHLPNDQRITKRISADGLLIVLPYTNFTPGLWRIDCHVTADAVTPQPSPLTFTGRGSLQTLKLEVLATGADGFGDGFTSFGGDWSDGSDDRDQGLPDFLHDLDAPSSPSPDELSPLEVDLNQERVSQELNRILSPDLTANRGGTAALSLDKPPVSPILQIANQQSEELVQSVFEEFSLFEDDDEPETVAQVLPPTAATTDEVLYAEHTANETPWNAAQSLLKIQQSQYILSNDDVFHLRGEVYRTGELQVALRNPQTLEVVIDTYYPIPSELTVAFVGGFRFAYDVYIPPLEATPVLIGEVTFHPDRPIEEAYKENYITQSAITVTYPASRLWAAMHQAASLATPSPAPPSTSPPAPPEKKIRLPQLPNFFNKKTPTVISDDDWENLHSYQSEHQGGSSSHPTDTAIPSDVNTIGKVKQKDLPYLFEDSTIPNQEYEQLLEQPMWQPTVEPSVTDRFLNKLQNLSTEAEEEDELFGLNATPINSGTIEATPENPELAELDQQLDREIERLVVEEYLWQPPEVMAGESSAYTPLLKGVAMSTSMDVLPVPTMSLPEGELIAGLPLSLTIQVPQFSAMLWVKLWVKDNQTRLIVDGPRWLVEFNHERDNAPLEVSTSITLPLGCMEVTFEAITVEATTKRESHRSRLVRPVVPPQFAGFKG